MPRGNLIKRITRKLKLTFADKATRSFIRHNLSVWHKFYATKSHSEVLFELSELQPNIIAYSYFANSLAKKHNAKIRAYRIGENAKIEKQLKILYKSFNADPFSYRLSLNQQKELNAFLEEIMHKLKTKADVCDLHVDKVWVGDLIIDSHLRYHQVPTVDIGDKRFKITLKKALFQFIFWRDYYRNNTVKAINVTHCCYLNAIPLRLAVHNGIPGYQINAHGCYSLSKQRPWAYNDFYDYPEQFAQLDSGKQEAGLKLAKERIAKRFNGEIGVDMPYSKKSAYTSTKKERVLTTSKAYKILIATHCFFDSPNGVGPNLFIDFYDWIDFLGRVSDKTDYEWVMKTHPDFLPGNIPILRSFIKKYPKFKLIPPDTSHHQLIEEGIDCALTMYGTIGWEYAAFGKLVVTASQSNPHVRYNFNLHPKNIYEYEQILMNLPNLHIDIDIDEVYQYYFMRLQKNQMQDWLFFDFEDFVKEIGGAKNMHHSFTYTRFLDGFNKHSHHIRLKLLENFINSKDYAMRRWHC